MTKTQPPHLALFFAGLFAAQSILFPLLAQEANMLMIALG